MILYELKISRIFFCNYIWKVENYDVRETYFTSLL